MSYAALLVYLEADGIPEERVHLAATLADRFGARLIGLSALGVRPPVVADGMVMVDVTQIDIELVRKALVEKGDWFDKIASSDHRKLEWRSALDFPTDVLAREARSADLVIIGQRRGPGGVYRSLNPGEAILKMGRPTLIVPDGVSSLRGEHVVIGWKDTREARSAMRDALPFLKDAIDVTIVESCSPEEEKNAIERVNDVAGYLKGHQINSVGRVVAQENRSHAEPLMRIAREQDADLLVTGAYGHSRLGEWIFGGVTRQLLSISPICCLMSH